MIQLTRLNRLPLILNSDLIEHIEVTPDTVITLTTGQRYIVLESTAEVIEKVVVFRKAIAGAGNYALQAGPPARIAGSEPRPCAAADTHGG